MGKTAMVVCAALLLVTVGAALGCGGGGDSGMTPAEVADKYMRASIDLDVDTLYDLMSEADRKNITKEQMQEMAGAEVMTEGLTYEIGEETIEGDRASVAVTIFFTDEDTGETQEFTDKLDLIKESGGWKIYFGDSL